MTPDPDRFVKVFDVLDSGFRDWNFAAFGLIFVAIGTIIFVFPKILEAARIPYFPSRSLTLFRYGFLGFALLWTTLAFVTTYASHLHHVRLARDNRCRIAEGRVEHFVPMPPTGHGREAFTVSGVLFSYSDFEVTDAFNNTASRGGPVDADAYVRICYDPAGNAILRLEIRDFTGEKKNYATADGLFPSGADVRHLGDRSSSPLAWDGYLFVWFYFLDQAAIQALFLPYLRTFFRLKTVMVGDCPLPPALDAGQKIRLRSSLIYWDKDNHAIWLRPRGFVRLQLPVTIARMQVDAHDRSITAGEIRFSSGTPVVAALFLWAGYRMFSAVPVNPPPTLFVGVAALVILVGGIMNLRRFRAQMERLVADALSEIKAM